MKNHLSKVQMSADAIVITQPHQTHMFNKYQSYVENPELWHKVVICRNGLVNKFVLRIIMNYVHPFDFIPVCFSKENGNGWFFIRNCANAIDKLCKELVVPNPINKNNPFSLKVTLGYCNTSNSELNVEDNILKVLNKRYTPRGKYLKLDKFHEDCDLTEFCVLSQPQILNYVLFLSRKFEIHHLSLRNNDIYSLRRVEEFSNMKLIKVLDLRNNSINDMSEMQVFEGLKITALYLECNPLCESYSKLQYASEVKQIIPTLKSLDGGKVTGCVTTPRNFLCNMEAYELIDQFLSHYFPLYDSRVRDILGGMYDENAIFSFSSAFKPDLLTNHFINFVDLRRADKCVITGSDNILNVLNGYPKTKHDPYTFAVDVIYYTDETAILTVTGRLRQLAPIHLGADGILHFARTFVLSKRLCKEYKIVNDIWVVTPPTSSEIFQQFDVPKDENGQLVKSLKLVRIPTLIAFNESDRDCMVSAFAKITSANLHWSRSLLDSHKFNLLNALKYFSYAYEMDRLHPDVLIHDTAEKREIKDKTESTNSLATEETKPTTTVETTGELPVNQLTPNHPQETPSEEEIVTLQPNQLQKKKRVLSAAQKLKRRTRTVRIRDLTGRKIRMPKHQAVHLGLIPSFSDLCAS